MTTRTYDRLPGYLRKYCARQDYDRYTPQDHAAWRYIMRQCREFFRDHAVPVYLEGLKKTGIPLDRIPRIDEMDEALGRFGWGAIAVCGFIPPSAFLDFQARRVLPIAVDMRNVGHIAYTPAPDIVHEAAGHAPIIADPAYADYLCRYATLAQKAIMSQEDVALYEAIRLLSDVKENPDSTQKDVHRAEAALERAIASISHDSEAALVARMNWWTVEYGLAGDLKSPKIYGAGLLSSVGESQNCLSPSVKKIPLSMECIKYSYDITRPQPQLFVTPNMEYLSEVLVELEETMAFRIGGIEGLRRALRAATVNTIVFDTGLSVSGKIVNFESEEGETVDFVKLGGPVQLCLRESELPGHGRERHPDGFSCPIGPWALPSRTPGQPVSQASLARMGLEVGKKAEIRYHNGFRVEGKLSGTVCDGDRVLALTFKACTVARGNQVHFEPAWGEFDLPIAEAIVSVHGGPADRESYGEYDVGLATTSPGRQSPYTEEEKTLFRLYETLRALRGEKRTDRLAPELSRLATAARTRFSGQWLLQLEILELAYQRLGRLDAVQGIPELEKHLLEEAPSDKVTEWLVRQGHALVRTPD